MKVRIAVSVNSVGGWAAIGGYGMPDQKATDAVSEAVTELGTGASIVHWVEADVPEPPMPQVVPGAVSESAP